MEWTKKLLESDYSIPILVSPHAHVSPYAQLSMGTVVEPMAVVNANTHIGNGTFISAGAVVDHNVFVADYCNIQCGTIVMPGALVPNLNITQPNEVVRRLPMSFSLENKDGETTINGTPIEVTSDGNVEG